MPMIRGRNKNTNDTAISTIITINSATATTLVSANPDRLYLEICLFPGTTSIDAFIRMYAAATDNIKQGTVLTRRILGNDNLFRPAWIMQPDNIITDEFSAISLSGTFDLLITEY